MQVVDKNTNQLEELAATIQSSESIAALTGAGISVSSGIPDFRSEDGLWTKYDPSIYASYQQFIRDPSYFWEMHLDIMVLLEKASPNPAHEALAALETLGKLKGITTQNIDGLHQRAGCQTVYELHGTNESSSCTICGRKYDTKTIADRLFSFEKAELIELMHKGREIPTCDCGGWIKPDVILFGELMPPGTFQAAEKMAASCDILLVVGTSLQVEPAASIPFVTHNSGGKIVIINRDPTPLDWMADHVFLGKAEKILPHLMELVLK
jgi:NAD-dependent deacetylase